MEQSELSPQTQKYQRRLAAIKDGLRKAPNSVKFSRQLATLNDELRSATQSLTNNRIQSDWRKKNG